MTLSHTEGTHWCVANDRVVLLDLKADLYSCLPDATDRAYRRFLSDAELDEDDLAALATLRTANLLPFDRKVPPLALSLASSSLLDQSLKDPPTPASLLALWDQIFMGLRLKITNLDRLIERVRRRKQMSGVSNDIPPDIRTSIGRFMASRCLLSRQSQCLRTSLALVVYLARHGYYPDLVIGVRMKPFGAHAWVQAGSIVLNDTVDEVAPFTPIVVV